MAIGACEEKLLRKDGAGLGSFNVGKGWRVLFWLDSWCNDVALMAKIYFNGLLSGVGKL